MLSSSFFRLALVGQSIIRSVDDDIGIRICLCLFMSLCHHSLCNFNWKYFPCFIASAIYLYFVFILRNKMANALNIFPFELKNVFSTPLILQLLILNWKVLQEWCCKSISMKFCFKSRDYVTVASCIMYSFLRSLSLVMDCFSNVMTINGIRTVLLLH